MNMRILHIDETFHPAFGYQCNPLAKFQKMQGHEVIILTVEKKYIYPVYKAFGETGEHLDEQDRDYQEKTGVEIIRIPAKGYIANRLNYDKKALYSAVEKINPDVILSHCFETLTSIRIFFKFRKKYPIVFDSHMLGMASTNKYAKIYEAIFKRVITPRVVKDNIPVILTQDDDYVNSHLGMPKELTPFISFGTDTELFKPSKETRNKFIHKQNLRDNSFIIVSTGKLSPSKGGKLFAEAVAKKFSTVRDIVIVIVANLNGEYEREVKKMLDQSENKVFFYPVQDYTDLPYFYQIADVCVFPKQCSMSFYDVEACGVPVISEDNNVNLDRNSHGNGLCFKKDDVNDFRKTIEKIANMTPETYAEMSRACTEFIKNSYDYSMIAKKYTELMETQVKSFNR